MKNKMWTRLFSFVLCFSILCGISPLVILNVNAANENVVLDVPWQMINNCGHQVFPGPCLAYCWAYCRIILDKKNYTYRNFYVSDKVGAVGPSSAGYNDGNGTNTTQELLKVVYDNINIGRPVMLRVKGANGWQYHFVVAIGYKSGIDPNSLKTSDILILDPASTTINASAGSNSTYTYLSSHTVSGNRYWTAKSGGVNVVNSNNTNYTVKLNANGGTISQSTLYYSAGNSLGNLPTPNRTGYTFVGWYTSSSSGTKVTSSTKVTSNLTLYAHWMEIKTTTASGEWIISVPANYKLLCYKNSTDTICATWVNAAKASYQIYCTQKAVLSNGSIRYYAGFNDNKDHYWFTYSNGMTVKTSEVEPAQLRVTFDPCGGYVSISNKTVTVGETYGSLPLPTKDGYEFAGWFTAPSSGTNISAVSKVNLSGNQTLYAHWVRSTITINFDAAGGYLSNSSMQFNIGDTFDNLPVPTRRGYDFYAWCTGPDENGRYYYNTTKVSAKDDGIVLYAVWRRSEDIKVTYDTMGGYTFYGGAIYNIEFDDLVYKELPIPEKAGYQFVGWYTRPDGGTRVSDGMPLIQEESHSIYAHWELVNNKPEPSNLSVSNARVVVSYEGIFIAFNAESNYTITGGEMNFYGPGDEFMMGGPWMISTKNVNWHNYHPFFANMVKGKTYYLYLSVEDSMGGKCERKISFVAPFSTDSNRQPVF